MHAYQPYVIKLVHSRCYFFFYKLQRYLARYCISDIIQLDGVNYRSVQ